MTLPSCCSTRLAEYQTTGSLAKPNFATATASELQYTSAGEVGNFKRQNTVAPVMKLLERFQNLSAMAFIVLSTKPYKLNSTTRICILEGPRGMLSLSTWWANPDKLVPRLKESFQTDVSDQLHVVRLTLRRLLQLWGKSPVSLFLLMCNCCSCMNNNVVFCNCEQDYTKTLQNPIRQLANSQTAHHWWFVTSQKSWPAWGTTGGQIQNISI